ncbi:MAG: hypothetical protein WCP45_14915 [Verrucomicrobiota bacterium]
MIPQSYIRFSPPLSLNMRLPSSPRPRVAPIGGTAVQYPAPVLRSISQLAVRIMLDGLTRTITAYLSPIPRPILIYGPDDFPAACADSMDDHCERVLQCLGTDPAATLQALINGGDPPAPPVRIPRQVELWQAKSIMAAMGILDQVEAAISSMPSPQRADVAFAWAGNARLSRHGPTVAALAPALGLSSAQVDAWFIAASAKVV